MRHPFRGGEIKKKSLAQHFLDEAHEVLRLDLLLVLLGHDLHAVGEAGQVVTSISATFSAWLSRLSAMPSDSAPNAILAPRPCRSRAPCPSCSDSSFMLANFARTFLGISYIFMWRPRSQLSWKDTVGLLFGSAKLGQVLEQDLADVLHDYVALDIFGYTS